MSDATHNGPKRPFSIPNHVSPSRSFKAALMTPLSISTNIPPVVIKFTGVGGAPTAFNKLDFDEQTAIVADLEQVVGNFLHSSAAPGGDLFVFPKDAVQKQLLLTLDSTLHYDIAVSLTNMEKFPKGVINNVPLNLTDETIVRLLKTRVLHMFTVCLLLLLMVSLVNPQVLLFSPSHANHLLW